MNAIGRNVGMRCVVSLLPLVAAAVEALRADEPAALYVFPAGGRRGTTVEARIGGMNLHEECPLHWHGRGVSAPPTIRRTQTVRFEGPVIPLPDSQRAENYPSDYSATLEIAADAALGVQTWRVATSQGVTAALPFVVGDDPEVVEAETDGVPIPVLVALPVTANGRIYPREDVDEWSFALRRGQTVRLEVNAARLGSPLDAQLQVVDAAGRVLATDGARSGADPSVVFTAPADGTYRARIYDTGYAGLQTFVYRLTISDRPYVSSVFPLGGRRGAATRFELAGVNLPVDRVTATIPTDARDSVPLRFALPGGPTNPIVVEANDVPQRIESTDSAPSDPLTAPMVADGRIAAPGEVDHWPLVARRGETFDLEVRAGRLGSPLDSVLAVVDAAGRTVAENDDLDGAQSDSRLRWTAPADGTYRLRVGERSTRRGGREFAYRLYVLPAAGADFALSIGGVGQVPPSDALTVLRGGTAKLKVKLERRGGFDDAVTLEADGLPKGVALTNTTIAKGRPEVDLTFTADADAPIELARVALRGRAVIAGANVERGTTWPAPPGATPADRLTLAVGMPTPFRTVAEFGLPFAPRGGVFFKRFKIERGGYVGPLEAMLAEKQVRHLQGVAGERVTIPAGADEFDFPIYLPPWMELGRTSRSHVTLVGQADDGTGRKHLVSYTSNHQNEQLSLIVAPGRLNVALAPQSLLPTVEEPAAIRVDVDRDAGLDGPIRVELVVPPHVQGVAAEPLVLPAGEVAGTLHLRFAADAGPWNMPLTVRAVHGEGSARHTAEATLEIVSEGRSSR